MIQEAILDFVAHNVLVIWGTLAFIIAVLVVLSEPPDMDIDDYSSALVMGVLVAGALILSFMILVLLWKVALWISGVLLVLWCLNYLKRS